MFALLVICNVCILLCLLWLANSSKLSFLRGSALNPITFVAILNLFFMLDFIGLYFDPVVDIYEEPFPVYEIDIIYGYAFYLCSLMFITIGIGLGLQNDNSNSNKFITYLSSISKSYTNIAYLLILAACIFAASILLLSLSDLVSGNLTRQTYFSDNKLLNIAFSTLPIAFGFYLMGKSPLSVYAILSLLICSLVIFATGSRGAVILILIVFAYSVNSNIKKIPTVSYLVAIPFIAGLLLSIRYFFRTSMQYDSIFSFVQDNGGLFSIFFNTAEISMAEVIVTIVKWGDQVSRYPFESFVSGLMYPLPRSIFTFKPLGAGGAFTEEFSPVRWDLTRSEIVTTGFGDLYLQFGFIGSLICVFILAYLWTRLLQSSLSILGISSIVIVPFLMWWAYIFLRSGIFNMAGDIWSFMLVVVIIRLISVFELNRNERKR